MERIGSSFLTEFNRRGLKFSYLRHQDLLDPLGFILRRASRILGFKSTTELERREPVRVLSSAYLLFVYLPILAFGIWARKLLGYSTIADRYLYDLIAGSWGNGVSVPLESLLVRMVPRPDVSFVLEADEKRILNDRPEHTLEYIMKEKRQYSKLVDVFRLKRVSTDDPPEIVWNRIVREIESAVSENDHAGTSVQGDQL